MEAIVDTKLEYPLSSKKKILLRPGHLVRQNEDLKKSKMYNVSHPDSSKPISNKSHHRYRYHINEPKEEELLL